MKSIKTWFKNFICRIGWHGPVTKDEHDGATQHATCKWCGFKGMIDSQGNLF